MRYTALISNAADEYINALQKEFSILRIPPDCRLDLPVSSHADMNIFVLNESAVLSCDYITKYPYIKHYLENECGVKVILSDGERRKEYPYDIMLNVLVCDDICFSLEKHTCNEIKELIKLHGFRYKNIRQGYAACSSLSFGKCIISADASVINAAESVGIKCLKISSGGIHLEGYNEGFIGGASGVCENTVYFTGNVKKHPDGEKILRFIETEGFNINCLSDGELYDIGGIKFVKNITSQQ